MERVWVSTNLDGRLFDAAAARAIHEGSSVAQFIEWCVFETLWNLTETQAAPGFSDDLEDIWNDVHGFREGHRTDSVVHRVPVILNN